MKKHWLISVATLALVATGAFAQDTGAPAAAASDTGKHQYYHHRHSPKTLEEARAQAHAKADKLDKMTEEQWEANHKKWEDRRKKFAAMTPEERAAYKASHKRHHKADSTTGSSAPAPSASAPAPTPAAAEVPANTPSPVPAVSSPPTAASPAVTPPAAAPTAPAEMTAPPLQPLPVTPAAPASSGR